MQKGFIEELNIRNVNGTLQDLSGNPIYISMFDFTGVGEPPLDLNPTKPNSVYLDTETGGNLYMY